MPSAKALPPPEVVTRKASSGSSNSNTNWMASLVLCSADLKMTIFGIGPAALGRPRSRLIHPNSPFNNAMNVLIVVLLLYTALVVPVTVGFFWLQSACERMNTLEIDCFVDSFFIFHIFYTLIVGQQYRGVYVDDIGHVASLYIRGSFWFDLVTSIPVSYIDLWILQTQCEGTDNAPTDLKALKIVRVLKPLRILKMLRILKVVKLLNVFQAFEDYFRPPPLLFRVFRVLIFIAFLGHFCSCTFWLVKTLSVEEEDIINFTEAMGIGRTPHLAEKYFLSTYFINTIFTTVGFGDVAASSTEEQVFCVIVMYLGTMVFGVLLSEIESAVSSMRAFSRRKGRLAQELMSFLADNEVSASVSRKVLKWVDFDLNCKHKDWQKNHALSQIPEELRTMLVDQLHHDNLYKLTLFQSLTHTQVESLIAELWDRMHHENFYDGLPVLLHNQQAENFYYLVQGNVQVRLADDSLITELGPGDYFGEHALIGDIRSGAEIGIEASYICKNFVQVRVLSRSLFEEVLQDYDPELVAEIDAIKHDHVEKVINANADVNPSAPSEDGLMSFHDNQGDFTISVIGLARWSSIVSRAVKINRVSKLDSNIHMQRLSRKILLQAPAHGNAPGKAGKTPSKNRRRGSMDQRSTASGEIANMTRRASRVSGFSEEFEAGRTQSPPYMSEDKWDMGDPFDAPYFTGKGAHDRHGSMGLPRTSSYTTTGSITARHASTGERSPLSHQGQAHASNSSWKLESEPLDTSLELINEVLMMKGGMNQHADKLQQQGLVLEALKSKINSLNKEMSTLLKVVNPKPESEAGSVSASQTSGSQPPGQASHISPRSDAPSQHSEAEIERHQA